MFKVCILFITALVMAGCTSTPTFIPRPKVTVTSCKMTPAINTIVKLPCQLKSVRKLTLINRIDKEAYIKADNPIGYLRALKKQNIQFLAVSKEIATEYKNCKKE